MNIKEIALKHAREYLTFKLGGRKGLDVEEIVCDDEIYKEIVNELAQQFEALIAEIAKQNEPVAEVISLFPGEPDSYINARAIGVDPFNTWTFPQPGTKLYTFPPTAEQIANETAEAIAEYCRNQDHYCLATEIESGAWKEFK